MRARVAFIGVLLALVADAPMAQRGAAGTMTLSVVGTNDLHGGIVPHDGRGGLALFAGYVNNLRAARARDGGAVILLDAGDMFQGTLESNLTEGTAVIQAYNALGYSAAAIGNHDFDFGPVGPDVTIHQPGDDPRGALKARAGEAAFPFLAANLSDKATGRAIDWPHVAPSTMVKVAGLSIGVVGVITAEALTATLAANVRDLRVDPVAGAITAEARRLRAAGADVVIVAAHVGGRCSRFDRPADLSSCDTPAEIVDAARSIPSGLVDMIVAGHTHGGMAHLVQNIAITEAYSSGRSFGRVDLTIDKATRRVSSKQIFAPRDICAREEPRTHFCGPGANQTGLVPSVYEGLPITADPAIEAILAPTMQSVGQLKASRLGVQLDTPIRRRGLESPLGNLFSDAFRESTSTADIAINNTDGGLRADLPAGPLTYGSLFEVFPFDNRLVRLTLTGRDVRRVIAARLQRDRSLVGISGFTVRAQCSGGSIAVTLTAPGGRAIADDARLIVATTDFLATGGDGVFAPVMPAQGFSFDEDAPLARDAVADWLRKRGGRLREDELANPQNRRWTFPGTLPVNCRTSATVAR